MSLPNVKIFSHTILVESPEITGFGYFPKTFA